MNSPGRRSSEARTTLTEALMPGTTASAWALTSLVSWSRSSRRNGRTWTDDMTGLPGHAELGGGRYLCGTSRIVPGQDAPWHTRYRGCPAAPMSRRPAEPQQPLHPHPLRQFAHQSDDLTFSVVDSGLWVHYGNYHPPNS